MIAFDGPPKHIEWIPEDLHKQFGRILFIEPGDSDIAESNYLAQLWFVNENMEMFLLQEWDIRKRKCEGEM